MKKIYFFILFCFCVVSAGAASCPNDAGGGQFCMLDAEIAYIKEKKVLDDGQFVKFEELYREYNAKKTQLKKENSDLGKRCEREAGNDEVVKECLEKIAKNKVSISYLSEVYLEKYFEIMSVKQYMEIRRVRQEFKNEVLRSLKKDGTCASGKSGK